MKVLLFCCKGFETMEFAPFVDVMGWARNDYGMPVEVVTAGFSKTVISTFGIPILVDKSFDEIDVSEYDALAIPGGFEEFGFYEEAYDERFLNLIREFERSNKYIASVLGRFRSAQAEYLKEERLQHIILEMAEDRSSLQSLG